jgi:hypothetical protein
MCHCIGPLVNHHMTDHHHPLYACASCGRRVARPTDCCARPNFQSLPEPGIFFQLWKSLRKGWQRLWQTPPLPVVVVENKPVEHAVPATATELLATMQTTIRTKEEREEEALVGAGTEGCGPRP